MHRTIVPVAVLLLPALAWAGFNASSHKGPSRSGETHQISRALDGDLETAWMVDPEEQNKGQWFEIDVPLGKVDKVSLIVGWAKDDNAWTDHARLKSGRIEVFDMDSGDPKLVHEQDFTVEDKKERQFVDLPEPQVGGQFLGGKIKVTVTDVYPGKDFAHLALSEALVHMVEFDAKSVNITEPPSSEAEGHDAALFTDDSTRTYWATKGDGVGESFVVDGGRYSVSSIGLTNGPKTFARPKVIEITQSNVAVTHKVPEGTGPHWFELPALVGYTGSAIGPVTVKIVEVYPGSSSQQVAIAEVDFKATMLDAF